MAPFPESESMTIKRLEVALRKNDMGLLKDGAYKLHEKFHTGHRFEFIYELGRILEYVKNKDFPADIKEILCSTIEEILSSKDDFLHATAGAIRPNDEFDPRTTTATADVLGEPAVSREPEHNNGDVGDVIGALRSNATADVLASNNPRPENTADNTVEIVREEEPVLKEEDIKLQGSAYEEYIANQEAHKEIAAFSEDITPAPPQFSPNAEQMRLETQIQQPPLQQAVPEPQQAAPQVVYKIPDTPLNTYETNQNAKTFDEVAVFYDDRCQDIDYSLIKDYRNKLNLLFSRKDNKGDYNLLNEIAAINNIVDVKVADADKILSTLSTAKNLASFITTSQSQEITKILIDKNIDFEIPFVKKSAGQEALSVIPILGFSNIFVCSNCNSRSLKTDFSTRTLSVQCPSCDSAAFPDLYAVNSYNPDCNPVFWHRAFSAFVRAKIWVLINPPLDENKEIIFDFIKTACACSSPKRVYLLSKENDKREFYRQMLNSTLKDCQIRSNYLTQEQLCEDYIKVEITSKVFA